MKRHTYVRMFSFQCPSQNITVPLAHIAQTSEPVSMLQGRLLDDVKIRKGIQLQVDYRNGATTTEKIISLPVIRIEHGFVVTDEYIYQLVRIPPPVAKPIAPADEKKTSFIIISSSRYDHLCDQLYRQMQDLEAPIVHVQALFQIHEKQFSRVRGDVTDPVTHEAVTSTNLEADFRLLVEGLRYYYCIEDLQRTRYTTNLWIAGHQALATVSGALQLEPTFLEERGYLPLFADVYARLGRLFQAMDHISKVKAEGVE